MSEKLELWFHTDLTDPEGRYVKIAEIEISMELLPAATPFMSSPLCREFITCTPAVLAAQAEEANMSPHSSLWICKPGRVTPIEPKEGVDVDPNAALELILDNETDSDTRYDAAEGLMDWLVMGGFMPKAWVSDRKSLHALCKGIVDGYKHVENE